MGNKTAKVNEIESYIQMIKKKMMHYRKGENVEEEIKREELPFEDCFPNGQKDFLWMHVKGGTKVNNVVTYAKNALDSGEFRTIVWTGAGGGLVKTVSCAEIIKRTHSLRQVTRMNYTNIDEHWLPQKEGLDEIIVKRKIPCIHIFMSLDEIDESVIGLQKPNASNNFFGSANTPPSSNRYGQRFPGRSGGSQQSNQNRNKHATSKTEQRSTKYHSQKHDTKEQEKQQKNLSHKKSQKRQIGGHEDLAQQSKPLGEKSAAEPKQLGGKN